MLSGGAEFQLLWPSPVGSVFSLVLYNPCMFSPLGWRLTNPPPLALVTDPCKMRAFQTEGAGVFYSGNFSQTHSPKNTLKLCLFLCINTTSFTWISAHHGTVIKILSNFCSPENLSPSPDHYISVTVIRSWLLWNKRGAAHTVKIRNFSRNVHWHTSIGVKSSPFPISPIQAYGLLPQDTSLWECLEELLDPYTIV
jgi:hypothetical protein